MTNNHYKDIGDRYGYERPVMFETTVGASLEVYADGTRITHTWDVGVKHAGYKGWPTHKPPYGFRLEVGAEIVELMEWARNPYDPYPDSVLY